MLTKRRILAAACRFFKNAIVANSVPEKVVIDMRGANLAGNQVVNSILKSAVTGNLIETQQTKYFHNILEQDHRFIKRITG